MTNLSQKESRENRLNRALELDSQGSYWQAMEEMAGRIIGEDEQPFAAVMYMYDHRAIYNERSRDVKENFYNSFPDYASFPLVLSMDADPFKNLTLDFSNSGEVMKILRTIQEMEMGLLRKISVGQVSSHFNAEYAQRAYFAHRQANKIIKQLKKLKIF